MLDVQPLWKATKSKYQLFLNHVQGMRMRQKRNLFFILRTEDGIDVDTFLPVYGLHCGEFACFQILSEHLRKGGKRACVESR
jgi:hypothetical protein